jgi:hypothetical protein
MNDSFKMMIFTAKKHHPHIQKNVSREKTQTNVKL